MRIKPSLQEQRRCNHINLATHLLLAKALLTQYALGLGGGEPLVCELEGQAARACDLTGLSHDALGLRTILARHGLGTAADEHVWLVVLEDAAEGAGMTQHLRRRKHLDGAGDATGGVARGDADANLADV